MRPLLKLRHTPISDTVAIEFVEFPSPTASVIPTPKTATVSPRLQITQVPSPLALAEPSAAVTPTIIAPPGGLPASSFSLSPPFPQASVTPSASPQMSATVTSKPIEGQTNLPPAPPVPDALRNSQIGAPIAGENERAALAIAANRSQSDRDSSLPGVAVTQQRPQSSGLKLTVLTVSPVVESPTSTDLSGDSDVPEDGPPVEIILAHPKQPIQTFPNVVYPASIALNLGQPIQLLLEVSPEGQVRPIAIRQGSTVTVLDQLIQNLIREVPFNPATRAGKPIVSLVDVNLKLDPL
ncbi:MAG TPA: hypothetical protein V6C46_04420 [Coleofasciculaceae cyanobacterium]